LFLNNFSGIFVYTIALFFLFSRVITTVRYTYFFIHVYKDGESAVREMQALLQLEGEQQKKKVK